MFSPQLIKSLAACSESSLRSELSVRQCVSQARFPAVLSGVKRQQFGSCRSMWERYCQKYTVGTAQSKHFGGRLESQVLFILIFCRERVSLLSRAITGGIVTAIKEDLQDPRKEMFWEHLGFYFNSWFNMRLLSQRGLFFFVFRTLYIQQFGHLPNAFYLLVLTGQLPTPGQPTSSADMFAVQPIPQARGIH